MNRTELAEILEREGFDPCVYSLDGGTREDTLCVAQEGGRWCVYYTERGIRGETAWFATEGQACEHLLKQIRSLPIQQTRTTDAEPGRLGKSVQAIAFDCFGTLIDWEAGILDALSSLFERHRVVGPPADADLLTLYARLESEAQAGSYRPYRDVLADVAQGFAHKLGFPLPAMDRGILADSIRHWPAFPDTAEGLQRLKTKYRLAVISNIDDDLFANVEHKLGLAAVGGFDSVVTAEHVRSYKPGDAHFHEALKSLGLGPGELLIAACSLHHDIAPANALGMPTCHIDRNQLGASGHADATPTMTVRSVAELADALGC
ncbi:MAG: HAD-IA family hydrolase [Planctomycetota bacterium]